LGVELGNVGVIALSHAALGVALSETDPENAIPHLETAIELGGRERIGAHVVSPTPRGPVECAVVTPVFYDQEGARRDG